MGALMVSSQTLLKLTSTSSHSDTTTVEPLLMANLSLAINSFAVRGSKRSKSVLPTICSVDLRQARSTLLLHAT